MRAQDFTGCCAWVRLGSGLRVEYFRVFGIRVQLQLPRAEYREGPDPAKQSPNSESKFLDPREEDNTPGFRSPDL